MAEITILCACDKPETQELFRTHFSDTADYRLLSATSVEAGFDLLMQQQDVRLVIADYALQGGEGLTFLHQVGADYPDIICFLMADTAAVDRFDRRALSGVRRLLTGNWHVRDFQVSIEAALAQQDLQKENSALTAQLERKNGELSEVNADLETTIAKRTELLEIRNQVLQVSQAILDVMPVVVLGVDPEQTIVHCNEYARELFPGGIMGPLGTDRRDVLSVEVNAVVDRLESELSPEARLEVRGKNYKCSAKYIDGSSERGAVVVLIPLD